MALDTAKKELNEKALKDFRKQDQGVFHLFPRAAPSPCQLVLFSKVFREHIVKPIKKFFYQTLIDILTSLPYTNFTSRLVDKMLTEIES